MKATLGCDASLWKALSDGAGALGCDRITLRIGADGIRVRETDPAHIAMMDAQLPKDAFHVYETDGELSVAIPADTLRSMLRVMEGDVTATTDGLRFNMASGNVRRSCGTYEPGKEPRVPSIDHEVLARVDPAEVAKVLATVDYSEAARFASGPEGLRVTAESDTGDSIELLANPGEFPEARAGYSIEYLLPMLRAIKGSALVGLSKDMPLTLSMDAPIRADYLLAPRIEEEDE